MAWQDCSRLKAGDWKKGRGMLTTNLLPVSQPSFFSTVTEIAYDLNFQDNSYFSRIF
jgi:AraC-like DNA-binding protein